MARLDFVPQRLAPGERCQPGIGPRLTLKEQEALHIANQRYYHAMYVFNADMDARQGLRCNRIKAFQLVMSLWSGFEVGYKRWYVPVASIVLPQGVEEWEPDPRAWVYKNINEQVNPRLVDNGTFVEVDMFDVLSWSV